MYWNEKHVKTLSSKDAEKFFQKISGASDYEKQMVMAKITGNFKRGNEKSMKG